MSVSDLRGADALKPEMDALAGLPISFRLGGEETNWLDTMDYVVPSPGVPMDNLMLREAVTRHIPILSEIELAYQFFRAPLIAITGTNGKSTTTTLIGAMLQADGKKTFLGGNLGAPFIGAVRDDWDWGVVEISSFQLEWVETFKPRIALLLNVSEDHLDRYASFADYRHAKERIFAAQSGDDVAILNRDDDFVWALRDQVKARLVSFGFTPIAEGVFATDDEIHWRAAGSEERFSLKSVKLQGVHNIENMMAAVAAAKCAGVSRRAIEQTLEEFPGLEHRLEFVREKDGVRYYNDSKGTNVGAVVKSLASFSAPVILLAGGVDKGGEYAPLADGVAKTVRRLILFGAAKQTIAAALGHLTTTVMVDDIGAAVRDAAAHGQAGDVVLLSPACSSFDQFNNYAERGRVFKQLVQAL